MNKIKKMALRVIAERLSEEEIGDCSEQGVTCGDKPKKKYRRNIGHRQPNTRIRITGITGYEEYPASPNVAV
ncbi:unnamed protein product [Microthlaspi erraticum]|uniref:Uncharacterized protein n=1 Tax=Microthlaspi erraticum TaxID=1685480 RepID=A0A6D2IBQ0_9BRAS|nr:unnamed protein product [Microthlaspi erraticum]